MFNSDRTVFGDQAVIILTKLFTVPDLILKLTKNGLVNLFLNSTDSLNLLLTHAAARSPLSGCTGALYFLPYLPTACTLHP